MKMTHIQLKNIKKPYFTWDDDVCFGKLIATPKVKSLFEVCGKTKFAALSSHHEYLVVTSCSDDHEKEKLFLFDLKKKRVETLKCFPYGVACVYFLPEKDTFLVGSFCGRIFEFNTEGNILHTLEGHQHPPVKISYRPKSNLLVTWSVNEVLLWAYSSRSLSKRLKIDRGHVVIEAGHIWEKSIIFAAFSSGIILTWNEDRSMKEIAIEPPDGINMEFKSFSLSLDANWMIGVGSEALIVIYSITSLQVFQAVHFSYAESPLGIDYVQFLPCIHPQFTNTFLIRASSCIIIADFTSSSTIKVLKSHRYSIRDACISSDGLLLAVLYGNGSLKLYTLLSFFPKPEDALKINEQTPEVGFGILKLENKRVEKKRKNIPVLLDETKWKDILMEFGELPSKYRKHIWVNIMKLPRNFSILNEVLSKEKKVKFHTLNKQFPNLRDCIIEDLKNTLECLCYWSPFLAQSDWLSSFVLPFVELFATNLLLCFEVSLTIMLNWCRLWFRNWPKPSEIIMSLVDEIVCENDAQLWLHLQKLRVSPDQYAWPVLTSAFRQVFTKRDWLIVWDHILVYPPSFIVCTCAAFILSLRQTLLKCSTECDIEQLVTQETWIPVERVVKRAKQLHVSLHMEEDVRKELDTVMYLEKGILPVFNVGSTHLLQEKHCSNPPKSFLQPALKGSMGSTAVMENPDVVDAAKFESKVTSPLTGTSMKREEFVRLEETCLRNIQLTRKKLINRIN